MKSVSFNRTLTRTESMIGVFLALLIPVLSGGSVTALPQLAASMLP